MNDWGVSHDTVIKTQTGKVRGQMAEGARHIEKDIPRPLFVSQADTLLRPPNLRAQIQKRERRISLFLTQPSTSVLSAPDLINWHS